MVFNNSTGKNIDATPAVLPLISASLVCFDSDAVVLSDRVPGYPGTTGHDDACTSIIPHRVYR